MMSTRIAILLVLLVAGGCSPATAADDGTDDVAQEPHTATLQENSGGDESGDDGQLQSDDDDNTTESKEDVDPADRPPHEQLAPRDRRYDISEVYAEACVRCHGERGDGEGDEQEAFAFDSPIDEWNNAPDVDGILDTLEYGIHESAMRHFPQFTNDDRVALAKYVLDLRAALKYEK